MLNKFWRAFLWLLGIPMHLWERKLNSKMASSFFPAKWNTTVSEIVAEWKELKIKETLFPSSHWNYFSRIFPTFCSDNSKDFVLVIPKILCWQFQRFCADKSKDFVLTIPKILCWQFQRFCAGNSEDFVLTIPKILCWQIQRFCADNFKDFVLTIPKILCWQFQRFCADNSKNFVLTIHNDFVLTEFSK